MSAVVAAPIATAFRYIVPVDLPRIFPGYRSLPAVTDTTIKQGWFKPGLARTIRFADGSTSLETLLTVNEPTSFSYKLEDLTGSLRFVTDLVVGLWTFHDLLDGTTRIDWSYVVVPKSRLARFAIRHFVLARIRGMLEQALGILKADLESGEWKQHVDDTVLSAELGP